MATSATANLSIRSFYCCWQRWGQQVNSSISGQMHQMQPDRCIGGSLWPRLKEFFGILIEDRIAA